MDLWGRGSIMDLWGGFSAVHEPCKRFCSAKIRILEMISFIPFQFAVNPRGREQIICLTDRCSDLRHNRISRSFLAVAQAEVYRFRMDLVFLHKICKLREPDRRRRRRNSVEGICLIARPERKQRCKRVSADKDSLYSPRFDFIRGRHYFAQDKFQCFLCTASKLLVSKNCRSLPVFPLHRLQTPRFQKLPEPATETGHHSSFSL